MAVKSLRILAQKGKLSVEQTIVPGELTLLILSSRTIKGLQINNIYICYFDLVVFISIQSMVPKIEIIIVKINR